MELSLLSKAVLKVKERKPLVHHITNEVVMNFTANGTLAYGASPIMAKSAEEIEEIVNQADSMVLNLGTITPNKAKAMLTAGEKAAQLGIPIIIDPVGVGASSYRYRLFQDLISRFRPKVIRGNGAEMAHIVDVSWKHRGVDAIEEDKRFLEIAQAVAERYQTVTVVTGKTDVITDGNRKAKLFNGHEYLPIVTGTGCLATALIGATLSVEEDPFIASIAALTYFEVASEKAGEKADGPGSFAVYLMDELYQLEVQEMEKKSRIKWGVLS